MVHPQRYNIAEGVNATQQRHHMTIIKSLPTTATILPSATMLLISMLSKMMPVDKDTHAISDNTIDEDIKQTCVIILYCNMIIQQTNYFILNK